MCIRDRVDGIQGTLVRQTQFAEFERETHAHYEAGNPLTLDWLSELYRGLQSEYVPGTEIDEYVSLTWARIPHFYRAFYVFQYATGISAAHALAQGVLDGKPGAAENYLNFLKAGDSLYPLDALPLAGVDMRTPEAVGTTFGVLAGYVDRLAGLVPAR